MYDHRTEEKDLVIEDWMAIAIVLALMLGSFACGYVLAVAK